MKKYTFIVFCLISVFTFFGCKNKNAEDDLILGKWLNCEHPQVYYTITKETDSTFRFGPVEDKTIIKRNTVGLYSEVNGRFLLRFSDNNHMALEGKNGGLKLLCKEVK